MTIATSSKPKALQSCRCSRPSRIASATPRRRGIWAAYEQVRAYEPVLRWADVETLHELRISGKWLRYTLEFVRDALGDDAGPLIARVTALQDHLGLMNDADVSGSLARTFLVEHAGELSALESAAIGRYLVSREREVARLRRTVGPTWRGVAGVTFRRGLGRVVARPLGPPPARELGEGGRARRDPRARRLERRPRGPRLGDANPPRRPSDRGCVLNDRASGGQYPRSDGIYHMPRGRRPSSGLLVPTIARASDDPLAGQCRVNLQLAERAPNHPSAAARWRTLMRFDAVPPTATIWDGLAVGASSMAARATSRTVSRSRSPSAGPLVISASVRRDDPSCRPEACEPPSLPTMENSELPPPMSTTRSSRDTFRPSVTPMRLRSPSSS